MAELAGRIEEVREVQSGMRDIFAGAYSGLRMANIAMGIENVERVAGIVPEEDRFVIRLRSIMGMDILEGGLSAAQRARCHAALAQVGLQALAQRGLHELSGGQLQRALFARLALQDAPVLLLDEPFAAMDERTCLDLLTLMRNWQQQGKTVLAVLHDMAQVRRAFPQTLMLAGRVLAYGPTQAVLTEENLRHMRAENSPAGAPQEAIT